MDERAQRAAQWEAPTYTQAVQAHGGKEQSKTDYAVVKFADMSEAMQ